MACHQTEREITDYLGGVLDREAKQRFERHAADCADCRAALASFGAVHSALCDWREEPMPEWGEERMKPVYALASHESLGAGRAAAAPDVTRRRGIDWFRWLPTAASFVMLCVLLLGLRIDVDGAGVSLAFGGSSGQSGQREEMQQLFAQLEQRQDQNNIALMQAVLAQSRASNEATLQQLFTYFEQQRQRDMQDVRASYEQLVSSDYETVRSLQQLASFVTVNDGASIR